MRKSKITKEIVEVDLVAEMKKRVRRLKLDVNIALNDMISLNTVDSKETYYNALAILNLAEESFNTKRKKIIVNYNIKLGETDSYHLYDHTGTVDVYEDMTDAEIKNEILKFHKLKIEIKR